MANKKGNGGVGRKAGGLGKAGRVLKAIENDERLDALFSALRNDDSSIRVLEQVVGLCSGKHIISKQEMYDAVTKAVEGYEGKAKVSLIATATAVMDNVAKTARFIFEVEKRLFDPANLDVPPPEELSKLWKNAQVINFKSLAYVSKISEMRLVELERKKAAGIADDDADSDDYVWINGQPVPKDPDARERLRNILERMTAAISAPKEEDDGEEGSP